MFSYLVFEDFKVIILKKLNENSKGIKFTDKRIFDDVPFIIYPRKDYWEVCVNFYYKENNEWVWFEDEYQEKIKKYVYFLKKIYYN